MAFVSKTWISYSLISAGHKIKPVDVYYTNAWKYGSEDITFNANNNYWTAHYIAGFKPVSGVISMEGAAGFGPSNSKVQGQRPALYLIKRTSNRFFLFIITSVKMQDVVQRKGLKMHLYYAHGSAIAYYQHIMAMLFSHPLLGPQQETFLKLVTK